MSEATLASANNNNNTTVKQLVASLGAAPTGVYQHVLLQVLNACESDSAGGTLKGPVRAVGAGPGRGADVQVVRVLNAFQPGTQRQEVVTSLMYVTYKS